MLDFRIQTFLTLCETKSYTNTAKLLNITQPSVTQHIKYLQKRYHCKLFTYEGKTLRLTPEGEYFRRQAEAMSKNCAKIVEDLKRMSEKRAALRFGCSKALGESLVPQMIAKMMAENPELELTFETANSEALVSSLENGKVDFILTEKTFQKHEFNVVPVAKNAFCAWADKATAEKLGSTTMRKLLHEKLLVREEGSGTRAALERILAKKEFRMDEFSEVMECNSPSTISAFVSAGSGITFAHECAMRTAKKQGLVEQIAVPELKTESDLCFMYLSNSMQSESCKQFFEAFISLWKEENAEA